MMLSLSVSINLFDFEGLFYGILPTLWDTAFYLGLSLLEFVLVSLVYLPLLVPNVCFNYHILYFFLPYKYYLSTYCYKVFYFDLLKI